MAILLFPCKSMATISCHGNQFLSDRDKKHHYSLPPSIDALCEIWLESVLWLQRRCRLKMLTDDDGRTTDVWLYYKLSYEPSAQVS